MTPDIRTNLKSPAEYEGELLCACCGIGEGTGNRYRICSDPDTTHKESCEKYNYGDIHLCDDCEWDETDRREGGEA